MVFLGALFGFLLNGMGYGLLTIEFWLANVLVALMIATTHMKD
jgi:hypothetical protein